MLLETFSTSGLEHSESMSFPLFSSENLPKRPRTKERVNNGLDVQLVKQAKKQAGGNCVQRKTTYLVMEATIICSVQLKGKTARG